ncbi:hypothetical protein D9M72_483930 [compost metagenome]
MTGLSVSDSTKAPNGPSTRNMSRGFSAWYTCVENRPLGSALTCHSIVPLPSGALAME